MATPEELFISISPQIYRQGKSSTLMCQADLLKTLKHLQNINVLFKQKNDLKKEFQRLLTSSLSQINSLQNKMPKPRVPKKIHKKKNEKKSTELKEKRVNTKRDKIEDELRLIQLKLKELNY